MTTALQPTIPPPIPPAGRRRQPPPVVPASLIEFGSRRAFVVAGVMLAALLQTVDLTIVNVALPTIQGSLGATVDEGAWVVTAYVIANVVVLPMTPWLQARFGRKNYFIVSILGFTLASLLCGFAGTLQSLILFRIVQGAFGGGLLATAQVILRQTFSPEELGTSQSIFALGTILGPSLGPTLGGVITDQLSWQWIFDINVLPGVLAVAILWMFLRDDGRRERAPIDVAGIVLLILTVGTLQYVLDQGQRDDWFSSATIVSCTLICLVALTSFIVWELRTPNPIVDLRVLGRRAVAAGAFVMMASAGVIFSALLLLPQFTIEQLGFTNTAAGLLIGIRALPVALLTLPIGRLANLRRLDLRYVIAGGLAIAALGTFALARNTTTVSDFAAFAIALLIVGTGIAFVYSPLLVAILRAVPAADGAKASAFIVLFFQLGGSFASAAFVTIFERREQFYQSVLAGSETLARPVVRDFLAHHSLAVLAGLVGAQAEALAYADAYRAAGIVALLAVPLALLIGRGQGSWKRSPAKNVPPPIESGSM